MIQIAIHLFLKILELAGIDLTRNIISECNFSLLDILLDLLESAIQIPQIHLRHKFGLLFNSSLSSLYFLAGCLLLGLEDCQFLEELGMGLFLLFVTL